MTGVLKIRLAKIALLAALYILSGKLGLMLAVPPGYATMIWPASGIAIGMLIFHGWRLWPGVLIGSFILNCVISHAFTVSDGFAVEKAISALGIATGSTLQALAGYAFVYRIMSLPLVLNNVRDIAKLFILCGPAACLIAATCGVISLYASGILDADKIFTNWMTWWIGDTLGVFIFLPLMIVAPGNQNNITWRGARMSALPTVVMLTLLVPLGLTFYGWKLAAESDYHDALNQFKSLAIENENALIGRVDSYNYALLGGAGFFMGSENVKRSEWRQYVDTIDVKRNFPGINGIGYIAPLQTDQVDDHLKKARADNTPSFNIHPEVAGKPLFVITYIEPQEQNEAAVGLNIGFEDNRREAAEKARDSGASAITKRITLVQDETRMPGFLLLHPMYRRDMAANTIEERREALRGWIYAPFVANNFLSGLTKSQNTAIHLEVYDGVQFDPDNLIFDDGRTEDYGAGNLPVFTVQKTIKIMQQDWTLIWKSTKAFERAHRSNHPIFILVGGLLFTGLFGMFLLIMSARGADKFELMSGKSQFLLPVIIFLIVGSSSIYLYRILSDRESDYIQGIVAEEANKIKQLIDLHAHDKMQALHRMAQRWEVNRGTREEAWRVDAKNYISDIAGLRAVELIDSTLHVRLIEPLRGNEKALGINVAFDKQREEALRGAADRKGLTVTPPLDLIQGYKAFIAYAPIHIDNEFKGFIAGLFSVDDFLGRIMTQEVSTDYAVSIEYDGVPFYQNLATAELAEDKLSLNGSVRIYDKTWGVRIVPTQKFVKEHKTVLPFLVLIAGLIIAILLSLTIRYILLSRIHSYKLTESNILKDAILASTAHLIIATDPYGRILLLNQKAEQMLGETLEDILYKEIPRRWLRDDEFMARVTQLKRELGVEVQPNFEVFSKKAERQGVDSHEWKFVSRSGKEFPVYLTVTPLHYANGQVAGYLGIAEDITERKKVEKSLRRSEETFRMAMEGASIGMALVDLDGKWLNVNKSLRALLGYTEEEMLLIDFQTITYPDDLEADLRLVEKLMSGRMNSYQMEKRYIHKDGHIIWAHLSVSMARDADGNGLYFIAQVQDITERKEMEQIKSEFISVINHELRTPLTSIGGSINLIMGMMSSSMPDKAVHLLTVAQRNCERLMAIINDILDLDKIAAGQMRFDMKEENLLCLINQGIEGNQSYADVHGVSFNAKDISDNMIIRVDAARLEQALTNLLSNAAKFSPQGSIVNIHSEEAGDWVRINIQDSGPGIPPEFRSRIFGKFAQADSTSTRMKGGTGLGLHITKQIVEAMGGRIGFETTMDVGTTFWMEFPLIKECAA